MQRRRSSGRCGCIRSRWLHCGRRETAQHLPRRAGARRWNGARSFRSLAQWVKCTPGACGRSPPPRRLRGTGARFKEGAIPMGATLDRFSLLLTGWVPDLSRLPTRRLVVIGAVLALPAACHPASADRAAARPRRSDFSAPGGAPSAARPCKNLEVEITSAKTRDGADARVRGSPGDDRSPRTSAIAGGAEGSEV